MRKLNVPLKAISLSSIVSRQNFSAFQSIVKLAVKKLILFVVVVVDVVLVVEVDVLDVDARTKTIVE